MTATSKMRTIALSIAALVTTAAATNPSNSPSLPLPVTVLWTFPTGSWAENLAVRSNGQLLVSRLDTPAVYQIDPTSTLDPVLVHAWDPQSHYGALGIVESGDPDKTDVFYVNIAAFINETSSAKEYGVNSVWKIDMNDFALCDGTCSENRVNGTILHNATVAKITDVPPAQYLNGMVALPSGDVLTGDVHAGVVYEVFTSTPNGTYALALDDPKMKINYTYALSGTAPATPFGVNGLKLRDGYLYWTNTAAGTLNRLLLDLDTGSAIPGAVSEIVSADVARADDFVIRKVDGAVFVCQNQEDELSVIYTNEGGSALVLAGNNKSTTLAGVSAARFGRGAADKTRLYLTTSGGDALPINGSVTVPAMVAWVDTEGL